MHFRGKIVRGTPPCGRHAGCLVSGVPSEVHTRAWGAARRAKAWGKAAYNLAFLAEMIMATVRAGQGRVLMVVDVQVGVVSHQAEGMRVIGQIAALVERARVTGVPVIWVQHDDEELVRGTAEWQWVPELQPAGGELCIYKHFNSAFEATPLEAELARLGTSHIVLAGAVTNWCIRATAYGALARGYDLTLAADAHWAHDIDCADGYRITAESLVHDLNLAMQHLAYPGCRNAAVPAQQIPLG